MCEIMPNPVIAVNDEVTGLGEEAVKWLVTFGVSLLGSERPVSTLFLFDLHLTKHDANSIVVRGEGRSTNAD